MRFFVRKTKMLAAVGSNKKYNLNSILNPLTPSGLPNRPGNYNEPKGLRERMRNLKRYSKPPRVTAGMNSRQGKAPATSTPRVRRRRDSTASYGHRAVGGGQRMLAVYPQAARPKRPPPSEWGRVLKKPTRRSYLTYLKSIETV